MNESPEDGKRVNVCRLAELACWTAVVLAPILTWINGSAVSVDQSWVRIAAFSAALVAAIALRVRNATCPSRSHGACGGEFRSGGKAFVLSLLGLHAGMLAWGAWRESPGVDEYLYLPAGISHWQHAEFGLCRVSPPLVRLVAALPVVACRPATDWTVYPTREPSPTFRADLRIAQRFVKANGSRIFTYFSLARCACIPFSLLGAWMCYCWGRELFGRGAGMLAMTLWCFSPNIIAHGHMVTPDSGGAALGLAAAYAFWRWLQEPGWGRAGTAGLALGLAELARSTWIILFMLWPAVWLISEWATLNSTPWKARLRSVGQISAVLLLGLYLLNLGYLFHGTFRFLGDYDFTSTTLAGFDAAGAGTSGNRFRDSLLGALPVPLPQDYVYGIDIQKGDFESKIWWSYLRGEWRNRGWWYYYAYAFLIKVPLGTWLLVLLASTCVVLRRRYRAPWRSELLLLLPGLAVFLLVSSQTGFSHHMRYALPVLPLAFIWVSRVAQSAALGHRLVAAIAAMALAWSVMSSLWIYPHSLSYFNESVGGPTRGDLHLLDSNLDWGQDLLHLGRWYESHPKARPMRVAFFPEITPPEFVGIDGGGPPLDARSRYLPILGVTEIGPQPGWYAVSVNELRTREKHYAYFLEFQPVARVGYSVEIFHISPEQADEARRKLSLPPLESGTHR